MNLPIEITPCPIVESAIEVRFKTSLPLDVIVGVIYNGFQNQGLHCSISNLPIAQIPSTVRQQDPNLRYKPTHKLHVNHNNSDALIGSNVIILTIPGTYVGWNKFVLAISDFIEKLKTINFIQEIEYIGLRYLNFFAFNIFNRIKLKISFDGLNTDVSTIFKTEFKEPGYTNVLQITTGIHIKNDIQKLDADGSLIDITTVLVAQDLVGVHLNNIIEKIEMAHEGEKILFFSLLSDEYLKELNPKYKDYES